jgi:hypothetical protein
MLSRSIKSGSTGMVAMREVKEETVKMLLCCLLEDSRDRYDFQREWI